MIEGFACGVPVVASNIPVFREVGGDAARYFDPEGPREMADALEAVVDNEQLRASVVRSGLPRVKRHAWDLVAQEHLRIYARAFDVSCVDALFQTARPAMPPTWAPTTPRLKERSLGS